MKKTLSLILTISLILSSLVISASAVNSINETEEINEFNEDLSEIVTDYGTSDFITPSNFVESTQENESDLEIKYCKRLIVQSDKVIDTYNAVDVASGFENFYILQYETEEATNYAYEKYSNDNDIISVSYDVSYDVSYEAISSLNETTNTLAITQKFTYEEYKNDWTLTGTGMDMVLEKYKDADLPEITVAVIDSGINLNNAYLKDRIVRTGYNASGDGIENSEQDDVVGHGTSVSGTIMKVTTENIKIANYRVSNDIGRITVLSACNAILQAVLDGRKIINCSFHCYGDDELTESVFKHAYENQVYIFFAAGNMLGNIDITAVASAQTSNNTITVAMGTENHVPSSGSAYGKYVDITAPGDNVIALTLNEEFILNGGTSFSSPFMAGVCAMYIATHPEADFEYVHNLMKTCGTGHDAANIPDDYFGSGIVNALKLFGLDKVETPVFSYDEGTYIGKINLEIYSEDGADIYYTLDNTYPSPTNGILYTEPILLEDTIVEINAVAYKDGYKSNFAFIDYQVFSEGTDDMFTITEDGIITSYTGNIKCLKVPEKVNGITVKDIACDIMYSTELYGFYYPDTIKYIGFTGTNYERPIEDVEYQFAPFYANPTLEYVAGNNIEIIGAFALADLTKLNRVYFPNCKEVYPEAFADSPYITGIELPNVIKVWPSGFSQVQHLRVVKLPKCEILGDGAFFECTNLAELYVPNFKSIEYANPIENTETVFHYSEMFGKNSQLLCLELNNLINLEENVFGYSPVKFIEFNNIENIYELPTLTKTNSSGTEGTIYAYCHWDEPVELILPSTLESCVSTESYEREWTHFTVYGTKGTYAEQWATENEVPFYEINQENSIKEDIKTIWDKFSWVPLEFDARGFNKTYQWYGSYDEIIGNDVAISGADTNKFNPNEYKTYPYYYCIMTSKDGDSVVKIHSSICQNRLYYIYDIEKATIDYKDLLIYTKNPAQTSIENIVGIQDTTTYFYRPSYIYQKNHYYGTGSTLDVTKDDGTLETYTVILQGDVNGDSAVDVIDIMNIELAKNNQTELNGNYKLAGDANCDGVIDVIDYAQVVNLALSR